MQFVWSRRFGSTQLGAGVVGPLFLLMGILQLLSASGFWLHEHHWSSKAEHATGIVTEIEARRDADGTINYFPHVRFGLTSGHTVQFISNTGANPASWNAGDSVPVAYAPANPSQATIATAWNIYLVSIILGVLGVVFFDMGFALVWMAKRRVKKRVRTPESKRAAEVSAHDTAVRAANFWGGGRPSDPS